ncbi:MAG: hypothetical protein K2H16_02095 [Prevotella sp.]|nr:hypothetical protein [Prevotella sp.]
MRMPAASGNGAAHLPACLWRRTWAHPWGSRNIQTESAVVWIIPSWARDRMQDDMPDMP